jgi:hypothetical protein
LPEVRTDKKIDQSYRNQLKDIGYGQDKLKVPRTSDISYTSPNPRISNIPNNNWNKSNYSGVHPNQSYISTY